MVRSRILLAAIGTFALATSAAFANDVPAANEQPSLETRIAQSRLRLAELALQRAQDFNARFANIVPATTIGDFQRDVIVANQEYQAAKSGQADAEFNFWLTHVEAGAREAQAEQENALRTNKINAGTISQVDIASMQARADLYQLLLEQGRLVANKSAGERLAWQTQVLQIEVQQLNTEVYRNRTISGDHY